MKVRNGTITHDKAPAPVKNLFLNFQSTLAHLNTDSLYVNVDSIFFNLDKDYFSAVVRLKGLATPDIYAKMNTDIDLEKWNQTVGLKTIDLKGRLQAHLLANGRYARTVVYKGLQHRPDTVISSIPVFDFAATLRNGYLKFAAMPEGVKDISFNAKASCPDGQYTHTYFSINDLNATMLSNYIRGYFQLSNAQQPLIDAKLESVLHMSDLKKVYPIDSLDMTGDLAINVVTKGTYLPAKRLFPVTTGQLTMNNGAVQTKYYPHPLEKINIDASVTNTTGTMQSLKVDLKPVSFEFEGQPFVLKADLNNFDNLRYNITSNGVIDLGRIYQVFAIKGYDLKGFIKTNLSLQGTQGDAMAGRYNKLSNSGTMVIKNIALTAAQLPLPFVINNGVFRFDQDKMWFDQFNATYGKSLINLNGYLSNVIGYATTKDQPLRGSFDLKSGYILVDEMMVNGAPNNSPAAPASTGVVMIPSNLSLTLNAAADKIRFKGIDVSNFHGQLVVDSSRLKLNQTGFTIIGAPVEMDATYVSLQPKRASFDYHITAKEFDIKRAYNEIKIFHDIASSASYASGVVGLDYHLSGKLDENMNPVYPSLKGGGVLSIKKIKLKGFKLFNAVSSSTGKGDMKDPDLSEVNIKSEINNNILTISRTKMRIAGFRPRFEGQVSLDGKLNLKGRLGLPPFGIFGIPFNVTGTQSNPQVKLRRGSDNKLEETEDPDEGDKQ